MNEKNSVDKKKLNKYLIAITAIITLFMAFGTSFSWYLFTKDNQGERQEVQVMAPYFLYLMNPDDQTSLQFSVGNIHPGETKQIVICVSNKRPSDVTDGSIDIAKDSKFNYDLEFIYTENLPVEYEIYELEKYEIDDTTVPADSRIMVEGIDDFYWNKSTQQINDDGTPKPLTITKDVTDERLAAVFGLDTEADDFVQQLADKKASVGNTGKYLLYQKDSQVDAQYLGLEYKNDEYEFDYYLIEISWQDSANFIDYTKETDLLYVVVNAKQPLPKEQTENTVSMFRLTNEASEEVASSSEIASGSELASSGEVMNSSESDN